MPVEKDDRSPTRISHRPGTSIPVRDSGTGPGSDVRDLQPGRRSLRDAVILLARKLETLGLDVSDVTEMLGVCSQEEAPPRRVSYPRDDSLQAVERNCLAGTGK
jgi:hypothetical protein